MHLEEAETGNSQDAWKASLLWGRRDSKPLCLPASIWSKKFVDTRGNSSSAQRMKFQGQGHVSPLPFVILATTFLAESSTAHVEASSRRVFGMTGCLPGLSSLVGPFLLKEGPTPFGEGLWTSSFHTTKGWSKASSARRPKGATGWIFKLRLVCSL